MKLYTICISLISLIAQPATYAQQPQTAQELAEALYGPSGVNAGPDAIRISADLLTILAASSHYQIEQAILMVLDSLRAQEAQIQAEEKRIKETDDPIARELYHHLFVTQERIKHLTHAYNQLQEQDTWLSSAYEKIYDMVWHPDTSKKLADALLAFMKMEETEILDDYKKVVDYIVMLKLHPLPPMVAPWHAPDVQQALQIRASRLAKARIQMSAILKKIGTGAVYVGEGVAKGSRGVWTIGKGFLNPESLGNMYIQNVAFMAGSMALEMSDAKSQAAIIKLQKEMTKLQTDLNDTFIKLGAEQKQTFSVLVNNFEVKRDALSKESGQEGSLLSREVLYLNRSVAQFALGTQLLNPDLITLDRMFEASPMHTPQRVVWYNPFYQSAYWLDEKTKDFLQGDWQYDSKDNRFWQQSLVPFYEKSDPSLNSIFTEYIPPATTGYTIEIECTLIQTGYPFFMGIMFNKSRWISGNPECLSQYRLIGLYGTEEKAGDPTSRTINLCFAQQKLYIPSDTTKSRITAPFEQIRNDKKTIVYSFNEQDGTKKDVVDLERNPQTYTIQITTSPDAVTWRLLKGEKLIKEGTISQLAYRLNPDAPADTQRLYEKKEFSLFNYHGIGFMAPGCQASFRITKPETVIYSQQDLDTFAQSKSS